MSLYVDKDNIDDVETTHVSELEASTTFVGTVNDTDGDPHSGLFLVTADSVVFLDDCSVTFETFDRNYSYGSDSVSPISGFREVDATLKVEGYTDN